MKTKLNLSSGGEITGFKNHRTFPTKLLGVLGYHPYFLFLLLQVPAIAVQHCSFTLNQLYQHMTAPSPLSWTRSSNLRPLRLSTMMDLCLGQSTVCCFADAQYHQVVSINNLLETLSVFFD